MKASGQEKQRWGVSGVFFSSTCRIVRDIDTNNLSNGQFEYTTTSEENSWVKDGVLHIRPTLQDEKLITTNGAILNLTAMGICSSRSYMDCVSSTNTTNGTIINPIKSARLTTRNSKAITYGRIEVRAKLPAGKWLWPAIWMLPVKETYGPWPASGEMDITESRGNDPSYPEGGNDISSSTLHWGPDTANDGWWRTNVKHKALHTTFAKTYHTFGIEWSENYIFTYVDSRLLQVLYTNFDKRLWERGSFPLASSNGTRYIDPWAKTGRRNTPFDQPFYLILNGKWADWLSIEQAAHRHSGGRQYEWVFPRRRRRQTVGRREPHRAKGFLGQTR
jgi:beta-glucanase (GH16 family)